MTGEPKIGDILLRAGIVDEYQLAAALGEQARWGHRLGVTLIKLGFVEEQQLVRALAHQLRLPVASLEGKAIESSVLALVPRDLAESTMTLPLFVKSESGRDVLYIAMEDPTDISVSDDLRFRAGMEIRPVLVGPSELAEGIDRFYRSEAVTSDPDDTATIQAEPDYIEGHEFVPELLPTPVVAVSEDGSDELPVMFELENEEFSAESGEDLDGDDGAAEPSPTTTRTILRAVTQLLLERGLLDQGELHARVRALEREAASDPPKD